MTILLLVNFLATRHPGFFLDAYFFIHDNRMSKQFVNDVVSVTVFVIRWHEVPLPPLEGYCRAQRIFQNYDCR